MRRLLTKSDIAVIAIIVILGALMLLPRLIKSDSTVAEIYVDSVKAYEINLSEVTESYTLTPVDGTLITVEHGRICFVSSDCTDELCVNAGWLSTNGQTSACLPKKIIIAIKSAEKTPDILTY